MAAGQTDYVDLEDLNVRHLKDYLRERGAHVSGTKSQLLKRARELDELGYRPLSEIQTEDEKVDRERQLARFTTSIGEKIPEPWTVMKWISDTSNIPIIRHTDLINYFVYSRKRTFDTNSMKAKRQLKAKVFYEDRHVHKIQYSPIYEDCSHCYIKSKVIPSLPGSASENKKPDYDTWVCVNKETGNVHSAGCTCSAGEGEACNHVAALLYGLIDLSEKKKEGLTSTTSEACKWNKPRKRHLSPKKSQNLTFKKYKGLEVEGDIDIPSKHETMSKRIDNLDNVKPIDVNNFASKLKEAAPHAAFLLALDQSKSTPVETDRLEPLHKVDFKYSDNTDLKSETCRRTFDCYFDSLTVTEDQCEIIEEKTRGQNKSGSWKSARCGRLTSSNFGSIWTLKDTTPPDCTLKRVMGYADFDSKELRWGRQHEPAARRVYRKIIQKSHPGMKVHSCGLLVRPDLPYLGSSPDALLSCPHCIENTGVLEIKCPYASRFLTPKEAAQQKGFFCTVENDCVNLRRNHQYYYQVQGQMALSGRKWCDFFIWTLKGYSVERIFFDENVWNSVLVKLTTFFKSAVIPEIFSDRVKRRKPLFP